MAACASLHGLGSRTATRVSQPIARATPSLPTEGLFFSRWSKGRRTSRTDGSMLVGRRFCTTPLHGRRCCPNSASLTILQRQFSIGKEIPLSPVLIALGSNLGSRAGNLRFALQKLNALENTRVIRTSFLYETEPCYVTEQPTFLNAVCAITTSLSPHQLLRHLKGTCPRAYVAPSPLNMTA